jgi:hypothetical protein
MTTDRIDEANTLLRNPPVVGLALSRALGLHVVGALAKRHGIAVELRKGAPSGTVALVALPKSILEARADDVPSAPLPPVYAPDFDDVGAPAPLGARREGPRSTATPVSDPPLATTVAAVPTPPAPAAPVADGSVDWHPMDEPPVEQWRRETIEAEQAAAEAFPDTAPARDDIITDGRSDAAAPADETVVEEQPLTTRVPGSNLSHTPTPADGALADETDPMRPYRIHELITRHAHGVHRGHGHEPLVSEDESGASPAPEPEDLR